MEGIHPNSYPLFWMEYTQILIPSFGGNTLKFLSPPLEGEGWVKHCAAIFIECRQERMHVVIRFLLSFGRCSINPPLHPSKGGI